ncbi:MAG: aminomethyl transferase family protein, partial [Chloroflexi bacterium]|nr:aminomethyl transferase family protein [Chloroflexota bacterium]
VNAVVEGSNESGALRVIGQRGPTQPDSFLVLAKAELQETIQAALETNSGEALSATSAKLLRVEAGLPGAGELLGDFTPFEVELAERVSGSKGCYTGQEVLARQVTYDKVTRQLAQLAVDGAVEVGADVLAGDKLVGKVSSVATSPRFGELALAVLRKPAHEPGTRLVIRIVAGEVAAKVQLPE